PASLMLPSMRPFSRGMSRMTERAVTLLPEPDSPTIATVCFAATSNDTFRTTGHHCPSRRNEVVSPEIDSTGVCASPDEPAAGGGFAPATSGASPLGPMLILKLSQLGFSSRVRDRHAPARLRRGDDDRCYRARIRPPRPES